MSDACKHCGIPRDTRWPLHQSAFGRCAENGGYPGSHRFEPIPMCTTCCEDPCICRVDWRVELLGLRAENERLRSALKEACDEYEYAYPYKGDFLARKHGDPERLARLRSVLTGKSRTPGT